MKAIQENIELIPLSEIKVVGNIRTQFDEEKLRELADSIRQRGVLHPIVCRRSDGKVELIAGARRLRAAKMAGLVEIPAIVRHADDDEVNLDRIIENLQREDLSDDDKFRALKTLQDHGLGPARISKMTGLSTTTVGRILVLETLQPSIRKRDDVTQYAKAFIARAPEHVQQLLAERVAEGAITSKQIGHDVMPAIAEAEQEKIFSDEDKKRVIQKIVAGTDKDRPARAILHQERGKKRLEIEGMQVIAASKQNLREVVDLSRIYHEKLLALHGAQFTHLDPEVVIGFLDWLRKVHQLTGEFLERAAAARRR
jgi:ParB family chromosome partitioning protein